MKIEQLIDTSLIGKMLVIILPTIFVILVIVSYLIYDSNKISADRAGKLQGKLSSEIYSSILKNELSKYFNRSENIINLLLNYPKVNEWERRNFVNKIIERYIVQNPEISSICIDLDNNAIDSLDNYYLYSDIYTSDGRLSYIAYRDKNGKCIKETLKNIESELDTNFFITPRKEKKTILTDPFKLTYDIDSRSDSLTNSTQLLTVASPIYDSLGNIIGVLNLDISTDSLHKNIMSKLNQHTDYVALITRSSILFSTNHSSIGLSLQEDTTFSDTLDALIEGFPESEEDVYFFNDQEKRHIYCVPISIDKTDIQLLAIVAVSYDRIFYNMNQFIGFLVSVILASFLLIATILIFYFRKVEREYSNTNVQLKQEESISNDN